MYRRDWLGLASLSVLGPLAGCLGDVGEEEPDRGTGEHDGPVVQLGSLHEQDGLQRFDPDRLEIEVGETVEYYWDSGGHSFIVTEQPEGGELEDLPDFHDAGFYFRHTFDVPGRYAYECTFHFGMSGEVIVE